MPSMFAGEGRMRQYLEKAEEALKEAPWLTRERLLRYGLCLAFVAIAMLALDLAQHTLPGLTNAAGEYIGRDFFTFWSGAQLTAAGHPEAAYVIGPNHPIDHAMPYSPITMLLCWPLASLSYVHGFFAWIGLGLALCIWSLSWLTGWELAVFASIGTPAAFINILLGQTGYYTAALLAWGLMLVVRRPLPAGILLAMLCCKPQLGILVAVALAAGGHWRVLAVTAATLIGLAAASAIVLGPHTWIDFFNRLVPQRHFMESRVPAWSWMPTVFAMMRLLGTGLPGAYLIQGVSAISAALSVAALWRGQCPHGLKCAGLVIATFLATPYAWDYDAVVLMFSAAWLANEGIRTGFASWEKMTVLVLLTLPALSVIPAKLLGFQIAPILLWLSLAVVMRRALDQRFSMAISAVRRPSAQSTV